jgi:hypothetical protein
MTCFKLNHMQIHCLISTDESGAKSPFYANVCCYLCSRFCVLFLRFLQHLDYFILVLWLLSSNTFTQSKTLRYCFLRCSINIANVVCCNKVDTDDVYTQPGCATFKIYLMVMEQFLRSLLSYLRVLTAYRFSFCHALKHTAYDILQNSLTLE